MRIISPNVISSRKYFSSHAAIFPLSVVLEKVKTPQHLGDRYNFYNQNQTQISPWHDIPLIKKDQVFHFVNEIPKGSKAKMEIATKEKLNPIKQDEKNGNPRFYHFESLVNYGCFPQTWEDPNHFDKDTNCGGDNDPLDVLEIGSRVAKIGEVYTVKPLGVLGMIDEGEMDWKVIAIDVNDPLADRLEDDDIEKVFPGKVDQLRIWFRDYKIPDGKPPSQFAFNGKLQSKDYALQVIQQTHASWKKLQSNTITNGSLWIK